MFHNEALLEATNFTATHSIHGKLREENKRIKKRDLINDAPLTDNLKEDENNFTTPQNDFNIKYSPRAFNSRLQKKRLLRKKLLKKVLKSGHGIYMKRFTHNSKQYPVKTLQQHIFPKGNLTPEFTSAKQNFIKKAPSLDDFLDRGLMSFANPFVIKKLPYIDGDVSNREFLLERNSSRTNGKSYFNLQPDKIKPKRFFGGFLAGAITTLEMAIKVNIPIPFCQFPNSPCKL